jgi:hypothetical protein
MSRLPKSIGSKSYWESQERKGNMMTDKQDLITDLAYMASRPELFTKKEMAAKMVEAAEAIATLRTLVGIRQEIELEDAEPEGNA